MGKRINQYPDINRKPVSGDLYLIDTGSEGYKSMTHSRLVEIFKLKKKVVTAAGGETSITVGEAINAVFSVIFQSMTPLDEFLTPSPTPVPAGKYRVDYSAGDFELGTAPGVGEVLLFLFY